MNDLFDHHQRSPEGGIKGWSPPPLAPSGVGKVTNLAKVAARCGEPSQSPPHGASSANAQKVKKIKNETGLHARLEACYEQLEEANAELATAKRTSDVFADRFQAADTSLRDALAARAASDGKHKLLDYYDARLYAGHAWHPHRRRFDEASRWRKSLMEEAQAINKELGA